MTTLFKISNTERQFLNFDTEITSHDKEYIKESWKEIKESHPTLDRMDQIGELLENYLPKYGLKAEFMWDEDMILD